jgi:hypothetical protein
MRLRDLISEWLEEAGETEQKRRRGYVIGVSGLREMSYDTTGIIKVTELQVSSADTADLPSDYINLSRIAFLNAGGILQAFASNNNIALNPLYNDCGQPISRSANIEQGLIQGTSSLNAFVGSEFIGSSTYIANHYRNGENIGGYFGRGGGQVGIYRIDEQRRQIQFGALPMSATQIVLEYLGDLRSDDGDFEVHPFLVQCLKEYITWRWLIPTKREGEINGAYQRYVKAFQLMRRRFNSETAFDWLNAVRVQNAATPRF